MIHFSPCNPALFLQTTASVLFYGIFLLKFVVVYLVTFGNITWKFNEHNFIVLMVQCPLIMEDKSKVYYFIHLMIFIQ